MTSNDITTTGGQLTTTTEPTLLEMRMDKVRFPRIGTYTEEAATAEMVNIVSKAFLYKGQNVDTNNILFIASNLVTELQKDNDLGTRYISFAEISSIVRKAVLTQDMFGISVASLYRVIIDYIKGEGHRLDKEVQMRMKKDEIEHPAFMAYTGALLKNSKI